MNPSTAPSNVPVTDRKTRNLLAGILLLGFLLRIVIVFFVPLLHMHRDTYDYYRQADIILMGRYLNYFPNGYPFIVAIAKTLSESHSQLILLWLNIILSLATVYFVYDIGRRVFGKVTIGLAAAFLMAVFPPLLNYVRWIMSETPTIFFLVGAYFFYYRRQNWWSGLFFGLATVVRTNIAPVFIGLLILELIWKRRLNYRLLITALIPILMVGYYCYWHTGKFSIEGNARINILYSVTASGSNIDFRIGEKYPEIDTEDKAMKMYMDHMKKEPGEYFRQRVANGWELWGFFASDAQGFRSPVTRLLLGACNFFLVVFGLVGWWMLRKQFTAFILILPFAAVSFAGIVIVAIPRYAYPAHPFMILLGVWTIWRFFGRKKRLGIEKETAPVA